MLPWSGSNEGWRNSAADRSYKALQSDKGLNNEGCGVAIVPRGLCWYDTAFHCPSNSRTYVFKDDIYWRYDGDKLDTGYPKKICDGWPGIPSAVQAAYQESQGDKIYFFKGDLYWRYTKTTETVDSGYPKKIKEEFEGRAVSRPAIPSIGHAPSVLNFHHGHCHVQPAPAATPAPQKPPPPPLKFRVPELSRSALALGTPYQSVVGQMLNIPEVVLDEEEVGEVDCFMFGLSKSGASSPSATSAPTQPPAVQEREFPENAFEMEAKREHRMETAFLMNYL